MAIRRDKNTQTAVSAVLSKFDQTCATIIALMPAGLSQIQSMRDAWKLHPLDQYRLYIDDATLATPCTKPQYNAIVGYTSTIWVVHPHVLA